MSAERWSKLYRDWRGNPFAEPVFWLPPVLAAGLVVLHALGIRWWAASGLTSRPAYWLTASWKLIPVLALFWVWENGPVVFDVPGWLRARRGLPTRVLDRREVPVLPEKGALRHFIERGEPGAWELDVPPAEFRQTKLSAKTELRCAACGALWTGASETEDACFACRAAHGVLAVHIPPGR